jgi:hypothetical protein
MSTPAIGANCVSGFLCIPNPTSKGIDVSFRITDATGIRSLSLVRAAVMDIAQAIVLQTWTGSASAFTWSDTDAILQQTGGAYYWLKMEPLNVNGSEQIVGPQFILLNPSLLPPLAATGISASHAAAVNGTVLVTCNVAGIPAGGSVKIYVTGYEGNPSPVAVAQRTSSPIQFTLQATGETVTIKAVAVSAGGAEASSGPTCALTLTGSATVPAQPQGVSVAQLPTGNQVMWPASLEAGVTGYQLWRGQRGDAFSAATLLASPPASGAGTVIYLDTGGLAGDYQYFVIAVSAAGNSLPSPAANPIVLYSSSQIPTNVPANTTNSCVLDSIPVSGTATVRIYGSGGLGTSYTRVLGFGTVTRVPGSVTGLVFLTRYYIIYHAGTYLASTTYSDTLPDGYEWVGTLTTCPSTGNTPATCNLNFITSGTSYHLSTVDVGNLGYGYGTAAVVFAGGVGPMPTVIGVCDGGQVVSYIVKVAGNMTDISLLTVDVNVATPYQGGGAGNGGARYVLSS